MVTAETKVPTSEGWGRFLPDQSAQAKIIDLSGIGHGSGEVYGTYDRLIDQAWSCQEKHDCQGAIAYYTKAIQLEPKIAGVYVNRGAAYESIGNLGLALQDFNTALDLDPSSQGHYNRGNIYFKKGDYDRAISDYTKALDLNPLNLEAYIYRGHSYIHKSYYSHAIRDYEMALALDSNNAATYVNIGTVHSHSG